MSILFLRKSGREGGKGARGCRGDVRAGVKRNASADEGFSMYPPKH